MCTLLGLDVSSLGTALPGTIDTDMKDAPQPPVPDKPSSSSGSNFDAEGAALAERMEHQAREQVNDRINEEARIMAAESGHHPHEHHKEIWDDVLLLMKDGRNVTDACDEVIAFMQEAREVAKKEAEEKAAREEKRKQMKAKAAAMEKARTEREKERKEQYKPTTGDQREERADQQQKNRKKKKEERWARGRNINDQPMGDTGSSDGSSEKEGPKFDGDSI